MRLSRIFYFWILILSGVLPVSAQRIAVLIPDKSTASQIFREKLEANLSGKFQILDDSLAEAVPLDSPDQNIFNLSIEDAQNFGKALGSNFFILAKAETLRRSISVEPGFYIESYAVIYVVSSRSGRLILWRLKSFQAPTEIESENKLAASIEDLTGETSENLKSTTEKESRENPPPDLENLPAENSAEAKNFRSPLPYRRLKPAYTATANLYGVTATVDATVDLDAAGNIERVKITRWAGYGLDESVTAAIRKMQWRAAERGGKPLPIRVLLRYNFKKIEHDDNE